MSVVIRIVDDGREFTKKIYECLKRHEIAMEDDPTLSHFERYILVTSGTKLVTKRRLFRKDETKTVVCHHQVCCLRISLFERNTIDLSFSFDGDQKKVLKIADILNKEIEGIKINIDMFDFFEEYDW